MAVRQQCVRPSEGLSHSCSGVDTLTTVPKTSKSYI